MSPAPEHHCEYRERVEELEAMVASLTLKVDSLAKQAYGKSSERMPSVADELRKENGTRKSSRKARQDAKRAKDKLPQEEVTHKVKDEDKVCGKCGGTNFRSVGEGKKTIVYEYVPAHFIKKIHIQETVACTCCKDFILRAEGAPKVVEGGKYSASFMAHLCVAKCADSIPLYRLEKEYKRLGIPIARSTMNRLLHKTAELLEPLSKCLLERIAECDVVQADETTIKIQESNKRGFMWTFLGKDNNDSPMIGYKFSPSRSGTTPTEVLDGTKGTLVVDAYTGYNNVTNPEGRIRAGCLAHVRRRFFEAQSDKAMKLILDVYRVEHEAKERSIVGSPEHLLLRQEKSKPAMQRFKTWLTEQQGLHPPSLNLGKAINYALKNWDALTVFLENAKVPVDNNASEGALRRIALGRKNFLFVGNDEAGQNMAGLYSLIATCEANAVNPLEYIQDVLARINIDTNIDDLLPHLWQGADE